ncbi:zinc finger protein 346-like, partial [Penaeus japonicus]|uniref:zinc finger protein 346-like n=1 Tax=Penaeus japonicus TaxID=27405 RepID=UPI001C714581
MDSTLQKAISDGVIVSVPGPSNYKCSLCKKTLCGDAPAKQHLSGKEHLKNGASYILTNPSDKRQSLKKLVSPGLLAAAEKKVVQGMRCRICGLDFTGVAPLEQHVTGSDHAKKLQVLGLPKTPQIAALHDGNGPMECGLCKVQCTGKQSYDEHVKGEKHKKKALSLGMQIGATASVNSTPKALSLGMQIGATASVNSTPKKTANLPTLYDGNGPIACILCKITCTGKQSYIEHVKGEKHRKKAFAATSVDNTLERTPAHFIPQALGATSMQVRRVTLSLILYV